MNEMIKELYGYRQLLYAFVTRNIKIKYKQTVMGFLWALFMPIVIVLSGIIVKKAMSILSGQPMEFSSIISVSVKALPWAFFVSALKFAVPSLVTNMGLVAKVYFPRAIFPLSYVLGAFFDFLIALAAFSVIFLFSGIGLSVQFLWYPVLLFILFLLTSGLAIILSCGNLFYRDVKYVIDVLLTFGIFFTPVFYDADMFGKWKTVLMINPVGAILENINRVVVMHQPPEMLWVLYAAVFAVAVFFGAWNIFQKAEPKFAECI